MSESDLKCEVLKSNRGKSKLHIDGYTYDRNRTVGNISYWVCELRRRKHCKGTVKTNYEDNNHVLVHQSARHTHPKDPLRKQIADFKAKLKERVAEGLDTTDLINEIQNGVQFDVLEHLPSEEALRQIIYREKTRQKEPAFEEIFVKKQTNSTMKARNVSNEQMAQLLELMGEDGVLVDGKVAYSDSTKLEFWKRVAFHLNSIEGGGHKNAWQWCKVWADWKNRAEKKADIVLKRKDYNLPGRKQNPTNLEIDSMEMKLLKLIGYPLDDKDDMMKLEMVTKKEAPDAEYSQNNDYLLDNDNFMLQSDHDASDKEDERNFEEDDTEYLEDTHVNDTNNDDDKLSDKHFDIPIETDESDDGDRKKRRNNKGEVSGHKAKKRKSSIEDYRLKAQIELEKEKQEQKKEELRLRAIELKLKGDELRLKEMEMNKVKYLTNIEEEKLKCFREISASLKEFLEMSRNGNMRLHNINVI